MLAINQKLLTTVVFTLQVTLKTRAFYKNAVTSMTRDVTSVTPLLVPLTM